MAETQFRGPLGNMGSLEGDQPGTSAAIEPFDGPMYSYQGYTMPDPRSYPLAKDGTLPARIPGFMVVPDWCTVDGVPQAASTTAVSQTAVLSGIGSTLPLIVLPPTPGGTAAASIALGVPLLPQGTTVVTTVLAIDFGFTVGTTVANSSSVTVADNTLFQLGGWYIIGNVANAAGTASLVTQVIAIGTTATGVVNTSNVTSLYVSPQPQTALFAPIGAANLWGSGLIAAGTQFGPVSPVASALGKATMAGIMRVHNAREQLSRTLGIAAVSTTGGTTAVKVTGFDIWGQPMAELLTAAGTVAQYGQKAWKYVSSIAATTTAAATVSVGLGDGFGFPIRCDEYQQLTVYAGNTGVTNNVGILVAYTAVASNTTGDVRGTVTLSNNASAAPITNVATSNGTSRLVIYQSPAMDRLVSCTPNFLFPLFGTTQATT